MSHRTAVKKPGHTALFASLFACGWMLATAAPAWSYCPSGTIANPNNPSDTNCYQQQAQTTTGACTGTTFTTGGPCYTAVAPVESTLSPNLNRNTNNSSNSSNKCKVSDAISEKYDCDGTETLAQTSQITNIVSQSAGSMLTNYEGIENTANAQNQGTMAASYEAAASTAKVSAYAEGGIGAMNIAMAAVQFSDEMDHSQYSKDLAKSATQATNGTTFTGPTATLGAGSATQHVAAIAGPVTYSGPSSSDLAMIYNKGIGSNGQTGVNYKTGVASTVANQVGNVASTASDEQKGIANQGRLAAFQTLVTGLGNVMQGGIQYMSAEQYQDAANALNAASASTGATYVPDQGAIDPSTDTYSAGSTALNPGTAAEASTGSLTPTTPGGNTNLGSGFNVGNADNGSGSAPMPTQFQPGLPQGATAPGGGSGLAAGGTPVAPTQQDNTQPRAADNGRQTFGYSGGGAAYVPGGIGAEKGDNLSGLLAQLLPQKKDQDASHPDGIMDFANRSPASQPYSLLGRDANLFKRIEEATQSNWRRGNVGT